MRLLFALICLLVASAAWADDVAVILDDSKAAKFLVEIDAQGGVKITPLSKVIRLGSNPTVPTDPGDLTPFEAAISKLTASALASGGSKTTGAAISSVYSLVSAGVSDGSIPPGKAFEAVRAATNAVLADQPDSPKWKTFRDELGKALNALATAGDLDLTSKQQVSKTLREIANGMNHATGFDGNLRQLDKDDGILNGIDIAKLLELLKIILQLIETFK